MNSPTLPASEIVLWALPAGESERWKEVLLTSGDAARIAQVRELAARDGFHSFRQARVNLTVAPDFGATVRRL
jgi:hypothetical protein